jgi:hypothetical protein
LSDLAATHLKPAIRRREPGSQPRKLAHVHAVTMCGGTGLSGLGCRSAKGGFRSYLIEEPESYTGSKRTDFLGTTPSKGESPGAVLRNGLGNNRRSVRANS